MHAWGGIVGEAVQNTKKPPSNRHSKTSTPTANSPTDIIKRNSFAPSAKESTSIYRIQSAAFIASRFIKACPVQVGQVSGGEPAQRHPGGDAQQWQCIRGQAGTREQVAFIVKADGEAVKQCIQRRQQQKTVEGVQPRCSRAESADSSAA